MRLALAMGRPDVDGMLGEITAAQLQEWAAFEQLRGPFGEEREDLHAAQVIQVLAEGLAGGRRRPLNDYRLRFRSAAGSFKRGDAEALRCYAIGMVLRMGGSVAACRIADAAPEE